MACRQCTGWLVCFFPAQPLMHNLESHTYEVFERDPVKYSEYQRVSTFLLLGLWNSSFIEGFIHYVPSHIVSLVLVEFTLPTYEKNLSVLRCLLLRAFFLDVVFLLAFVRNQSL